MPLAGAAILQVIPDLDIGGAERTTIEVAEALKAAGAVPIVVSRGGRLENELARAGGELIVMDRIATKNPLEMLANSSELSRLIRRRDIDLVHARSRAPAWSAMWAARRTHRPFVTTYHGVYNAKTPMKRWYNSVMARGDKVIANSEFTADHVRNEHPQASGRIVVIPRGVDLAKFAPTAVSAGRKAQLMKDWRIESSEATALILLPARLTGWKGQREAIAAAALLKAQETPPWRLLLVGDSQGRDEYEAELNSLIGSHGLADRVAMVGHCSDMPAALALADIVIAPSNEPEAFGRVAAEAGAMGVPVVGSDLGGQREVIVNGTTGLLTPPLYPRALADAMADLLARGKEGRAEMGRAAAARVKEKYAKTSLQRDTLAVYDGLIGRLA